ncbi:MAG: hypothetical protein LBM08_03835 [Dysgonamonadaceae bacterium]|jgi:microcystin-dependent protein|nr:hypothetical protein [Dysgonamonadaceae bacterium]
MNRAKYTNYATRNFPLSTEGLDFIQEQILLIAEYAKAAGGNFILSGCREEGGAVGAGTVIIDGEILPLKAGFLQTYLRIVEESETVTAGSAIYSNARTRRWAEFGQAATGNSYEWETFVPFPTNAWLYSNGATKAELQALQNLAMPKGAIILWSGESIPSGFHLCDGSNVQSFGVVPDLRGRFIIGQDPTKASTPSDAMDLTENYGAIGNTGGQKAVTLTKEQMPAHNHVTDSRFNKLSARASDVDNNGTTGETTDSTSAAAEYRIGQMASLWTSATIRTEGSGALHENRPPYYVLAYIIKVV